MSQGQEKVHASKTRVQIIPHGASLIHISRPSNASSTAKTAHSVRSNVLLDLPSEELYSSHPHGYFSATIGRVANRIANSRLTGLKPHPEKVFQLAANEKRDGEDGGKVDVCLHGGKDGWDKRTWKVGQGSASAPSESEMAKFDQHLPAKLKDKPVTSGKEIEWLGGNSHSYTLTSFDGDQGFPGEVHTQVWYTEGRGSNNETVVQMEWEITLPDIEANKQVDETVVALTNHGYYNLAPTFPSPSKDLSLREHTIYLAGPKHLPLNKAGIPIPGSEGGPTDHSALPSTPFEPVQVFDKASGKFLDLDDCFVHPDFVAASSVPLDTRSLSMQTLAILEHSEGTTLVVQSTEPAVQIYTGAGISVAPWKGEDTGYGAHAGVAIEPCRWVDAASRDEWRNMVLLKKGEKAGGTIRWIVL